MKKIKAASIHFTLSLLLFAMVMWLLVLHWFPLPYFWADGAWEGVRIAAIVDLLLGPLLTLIVYRQGKKHLKLDLGFIALVQVSALVWGCYSIYQVRPVFVVSGTIFGKSELHTVILSQIEAKVKSPQVLDALAENNPSTPPLVFSGLQEDSNHPGKYVVGSAYFTQADRYQHYSDDKLDNALQHGLPRSFFDNLKEDDKLKFARFMDKNDNRFDDFSFIPLHCRFESLILVYDKKQRRAVDYLNIAPL